MGLTVVCAWCRSLMRPGSSSNRISHGICCNCEPKIDRRQGWCPACHDAGLLGCACTCGGGVFTRTEEPQ